MSPQGSLAIIGAGVLTATLVVAQQNAALREGGRPVIAEQTQGEEVLSKGDLNRSDIRKIQSALNRAGYIAGSVDGAWGKSTDQALLDFQKAKGLAPTGQLDEDTMLALGYSSADFAAAEPIRLTKSEVRQIQKALKKAGYDAGSVDGIWGPASEFAMGDFQRANGINPTGRMDRDSVLALGLSPTDFLSHTDFAAGEFMEHAPPK